RGGRAAGAVAPGDAGAVVAGRPRRIRVLEGGHRPGEGLLPLDLEAQPLDAKLGIGDAGASRGAGAGPGGVGDGDGGGIAALLRVSVGADDTGATDGGGRRGPVAPADARRVGRLSAGEGGQ